MHVNGVLFHRPSLRGRSLLSYTGFHRPAIKGNELSPIFSLFFLCRGAYHGCSPYTLGLTNIGHLKMELASGIGCQSVSFDIFVLFLYRLLGMWIIDQIFQVFGLETNISLSLIRGLICLSWIRDHLRKCFIDLQNLSNNFWKGLLKCILLLHKIK